MRKPAEVFPPGEFLREELAARNWTALDLATMLHWPLRTVDEVVTSNRRITPVIARALAAILGTSPDYWLNLEKSWSSRLSPRNARHTS